VSFVPVRSITSAVLPESTSISPISTDESSAVRVVVAPLRTCSSKFAPLVIVEPLTMKLVVPPAVSSA
jgi:hypothetical protein